MSAPAIITLDDWVALGGGRTRPTVLYEQPLEVNGEFGTGWSSKFAFGVPSGQFYEFCKFAGGGYPSAVDMGGGTTATRYIPLSHPDAPALLCTRISGRAKGGHTPEIAALFPTLSNWSDAAVVCTFTSVPYAIDGSTPFMRTETRAGAEVYTLAGRKLRFPSDNSYLNADAGITVPTVVYTITIYLTAALSDGFLNPLLGKCNQGVFLGQPEGTMRFDSYSSSVTMTSSFGISYTRTIFLTFRPVPWTQFLRPDGTWENVVKPNGDKVYDLLPLDALVA